MLLLIGCKYRILEKHKPPQKKMPLESSNGGTNVKFEKTEDKESLIAGEEKSVIDMEIEPTVSMKFCVAKPMLVIR